MNDKQFNVKSSYDGSIEESDADFDLTTDSIDSLQSSNYYHRVMLNKQHFISTQLQNEYDSLSKEFYTQQLECKKLFDKQSAEFNKIILLNGTILCDDDFNNAHTNDLLIDLNEIICNNDDIETNKTINYINYIKLNSRLGQLKSKLNLELLFFMNLKSLRLNYTNKLETLKEKEFKSLNQFTSNRSIQISNYDNNNNNLNEQDTTTNSFINAGDNYYETNKIGKKLPKETTTLRCDLKQQSSTTTRCKNCIQNSLRNSTETLLPESSNSSSSKR